MSVKADLDELKEILQDLMLPREELARLEREIKSKGYHVEGPWLARRLMELGLSRGRTVEFFRKIGVEDDGIAYLMERAALGAKKDIEIKIGGGERRGGAKERLKVFRKEKEDESEGEDEDALRNLYKAAREGEDEN